MKSLRDQLLKAGLVDTKQARKATHEKRVERKAEGSHKIEQTEQEKAREWEKKQAAERKRQQEIARSRQSEESLKEAETRLRNMVRQSMISRGWNGQRRFYFVTRDRKITCLEISDSIGRKLEGGELAIVLIPGEQNEQVTFVPKKVALALEEKYPDHILFLNR